MRLVRASCRAPFGDMAVTVRHAMKRVVERSCRRPLAIARRVQARCTRLRNPRFAPVFVLGPPRSGTTLVYQAICYSLKAAYPTNLMVRLGLDQSPHLYRCCARLARRFAATDASPFDSDHGRTPGPLAPHEAGRIWNRWFPTERHYTTEGVLTPEQKRGVTRSVAGIEAAFGAPFVNKNTKHSVRIQAFAELFPRALFIEVTRDPLMTAQSIYIMRTRFYDSPEWPTGLVMPREVDALLHRSLLEQAAGQVFYLRKNIAADREAVGQERFLTVAYEQFCQQPNAQLARIADFMCNEGAPTEIRRTLPAEFPCANQRKVSSGILDALNAHLQGFAEMPRQSQCVASHPHPASQGHLG